MLIRLLPRTCCCAVLGRSSLFSFWAATASSRACRFGTDMSGSPTDVASSPFVCSLEAWDAMLPLRLFGRNKLPRPPAPLPPDFTDSVSPRGCLRGNLNAPFSFSAAEGFRSMVETGEMVGNGSVSVGSLICGMLVVGCRTSAGVSKGGLFAVVTDWVCAWSSGEDSVR